MLFISISQKRMFTMVLLCIAIIMMPHFNLATPVNNNDLNSIPTSKVIQDESEGLLRSFNFRTKRGASTTSNSACDDLTIGRNDSCPDPLLTDIFGEQPYFQGLESVYSPRKMWFARRLNSGVYVGGWPTARQIKHAAESGMKSIVSVFDTQGEKGPDNTTILLSSIEARQIAENLGMKYHQLSANGATWYKLSEANLMNDIYPQVELPAYFHCERAVSITMYILLHYINESRSSDNFKPEMNIERFYEISRIHNLDFVNMLSVTSEAVTAVAGEDVPATAHSPNVSIPMWFNFWQCRPIVGDWYTAGQISRRDLSQIKDIGLLTVVNLRADTERPGEYGQANAGQSGASKHNITNDEEFENETGYNETLEEEAVRTAGLDYFNIHLNETMDDFPTYITAFKDQLVQIGSKGPVLVHSSSGRRATYVSVLLAAVQYNLSLEWALRRLKEMGFGVSGTTNAHIYNVYKQHLPSVAKENNNPVTSTRKPPGNGSAQLKLGALLLFLFMVPDMTRKFLMA